MTKFQDLGLIDPILRAVKAEGYETATPIQAQAIPLILEARDVLGCAQTGTGKTAAFALPILQRLAASAPEAPQGGRRPRSKARALILSPTRELAVQIADSFRTYGRNLRLRHTVVYGGVSQLKQTQAIAAGVDIIVATPGRLMDLMNQGYIDLSSIQLLVLDEADRMLDMGFIHDIRKIVAKAPKDRQTLLFSATMPADIRQLANSIMRDPASVQVAPTSSTADRVEQAVYHVDNKNKPRLLAHYLGSVASSRAIVFTRTKHGADKVVRQLSRYGIRADAIHGDKSQAARQKVLVRFKSKNPPVLVATDVAARGLDIDDVSHVINYNLPETPESYVHRIGRTARAGASGIAISFCDREERGYLRDIERLIRQRLAVRDDHPEYPAEEPSPEATTPNRPEQAAERGRRPSIGQARPVRKEQRTDARKETRRAGRPKSSATGKPSGKFNWRRKGGKSRASTASK